MQKMIYSKYSNERAEEFQIRTDICEEKNRSRFVRKVACTDKSREHLLCKQEVIGSIPLFSIANREVSELVL